MLLLLLLLLVLYHGEFLTWSSPCPIWMSGAMTGDLLRAHTGGSRCLHEPWW
jgi:hypothetical protein